MEDVNRFTFCTCIQKMSLGLASDWFINSEIGWKSSKLARAYIEL